MLDIAGPELAMHYSPGDQRPSKISLETMLMSWWSAGRMMAILSVIAELTAEVLCKLAISLILLIVSGTRPENQLSVSRKNSTQNRMQTACMSPRRYLFPKSHRRRARDCLGCQDRIRDSSLCYSQGVSTLPILASSTSYSLGGASMVCACEICEF